ncbi:hypothetical protein HC891_13070 [Candidatus Gracilibacteria bacterium]|nr:hypothetical protein [Candidatus Gracilibacteria bacterium]
MDSKQQAQNLAETLLATHDEAACSQCLDALEAYVAAQLARQAYRALFPQTARHLDSCVACAESYAVLYEVLQPGAALSAPARIPAPNLSFLASPREGISHSGTAIFVQLAQALREAFALPQPPALAFRDGEQPPLFSVALSGVNAAVERLQVTAYPSDTAEHCLVQLQIELRERAWPDLADLRLQLSWQGGSATASTDSWGSAVFTAVPRDAIASLALTLMID